MGSLYDFGGIRLMAKDMMKNIGPQNLYSEINTRYPNSPKNLFLNVSEVSKYVKGYLFETTATQKIIIIEDKEIEENIYGLYVHYDNTAYIKINGKINFCWKRFAILKVLCSLYVDHYDKPFNKFDNYLESLRNAFDQKTEFLKTASLDEGDLDSETFSILLATELMIPINKREITKDLIGRIGKDGITLNDIAKSLLMPEFILKLYVDKNLINSSPQYKDF